MDANVNRAETTKFKNIATVPDCVSVAEKKQRAGVTLVNLILWLCLVLVAVAMIIGSKGGIVIFMAAGWVVNVLAAEYNVRRLQAFGVTVSERQFPEVYQAVEAVCNRLGVENKPKVVVLQSGEANAFALRFARKKVIIILTEMLEGIIEKPAELRALIGHEVCHSVLNHGMRGKFELYMPAKYRAARELTCDNAGLVAADDLTAAKAMQKKLCAGKHLFERVDEEALKDEAELIYSGITGWFIARNLTYPTFGARLKNLEDFSADMG